MKVDLAVDVYTSDSPHTISSRKNAIHLNITGEDEVSYDVIANSFLPIQLNFAHLPLYAFPLFPSNSNSNSSGSRNGSTVPGSISRGKSPGQGHPCYLTEVFCMASAVNRSVSPLLYTPMTFSHLQGSGVGMPSR